MPRKFQGISFEEALPRMVVTYNKGKLVPFTGSGMSIPSIPTWKGFLQNLSSYAKYDFPDKKNFTSEELIQISEDIVTSLSRESKPRFIQSLKESLGYKLSKPPVTNQCRQLAELWWPLVLSTNYDTMFIDALEEKNNFDRSQVSIYGRSAEDCHSVLASLSAPSKTVYWALQGFFGQNERGASLEDEIVVGFEQYRNVTYNNLTFRSAFAEVFRNNSLLFMGTGLSEEYFKGLFGEVLEKFGSNPYTHCALFNKKELNSVDHRFLHTKFNITAVFYEDIKEVYDGLPHAISTLVKAAKSENNKLNKLGFSTGVTSTSSKENDKAGLEIIAGPMPPPSGNACYVFSAGFNNSIELSDTGEAYIKAHFDTNFNENNFRIHKQKLASRYGKTSVYAAIARNLTNKENTNDFIDLRKVSRAIEDTLLLTNGKFDIINIRLLTAGKGKEFSPVFGLIQMVRGYKNFIKMNVLKSKLRIYADDPSAVFYFRTSPLEIEEILNCDDIRVNIEIQDNDDIERHQLYIFVKKTLAEVSYFYTINAEHWQVQIIPTPSKNNFILTDSPLTLEEIGLIPGSTIVYKRK